MLRREVRERERGEARADEAAQLGAVRGRLHRAAAVARVEHLAERALEVERLRRRVHDVPALAADPALDRPQEPRPAAGGREDRVEQEGRRGLAVRPGHARRPASSRVGNPKNASAARPSPSARPRRRAAARAASARARRGARRRRDAIASASEVVAVGAEARHADEERPGGHAARVEREIRDVGRSGVERAERPHGLAQDIELDAAILPGSLAATGSRLRRDDPAAPRGTGARTGRCRGRPARRSCRPR